MENKTPSQQCKDSGLTLAELERISKVSKQTLINWHKNKSDTFTCILAGAKTIKSKPS